MMYFKKKNVFIYLFIAIIDFKISMLIENGIHLKNNQKQPILISI